MSISFTELIDLLEYNNGTYRVDYNGGIVSINNTDKLSDSEIQTKLRSKITDGASLNETRMAFTNVVFEFNGNNQLFTGETNVPEIWFTNCKFSQCPSFKSNTSIEDIILRGGMIYSDLKEMFRDCSNLKYVNLGIDTSASTDDSYMFYNCTSCTEIYFGSGWNTSNVTLMSYMFYGCESLTSLDLTSFNVSNVIKMDRMFRLCKSLISIDMSTWSTDSLTTIQSMFNNCNSLEELDLRNFNVSQVYQMGFAFNQCHKLYYLNISTWTCPAVTTLESMFYNCYKLTTLDFSNWNNTKANNCNNFIYHCYDLTTLDFSGIDFSSASNIAGITDGCFSLEMFKLKSVNYKSSNNSFQCTSYYHPLEKTPISTATSGSNIALYFNIVNLKDVIPLSYITYDSDDMSINFNNVKLIFGASSGFESTTIKNALIAKITDGKDITSLTFKFNNVIFSAAESNPALFLSQNYITKVYFTDCEFRNHMPKFTGNTFVKTIMFAGEQTVLVDDFIGYCNGCTALTGFWVVNVDFSVVTSFEEMFYGCTNLSNEYGIENARNLENLISCRRMFFKCLNLERVHLNKWHTKSLTNVYQMFFNCRRLKICEMVNFDMSHVTDCSDMFYGCQALKYIKIGAKWSINSTSSIQFMFYECRSLRVVDLRGYNFDQITTLVNFNTNCTKLKALFIHRKYYTESTNTIHDSKSTWSYPLPYTPVKVIYSPYECCLLFTDYNFVDTLTNGCNISYSYNYPSYNRLTISDGVFVVDNSDSFDNTDAQKAILSRISASALSNISLLFVDCIFIIRESYITLFNKPAFVKEYLLDNTDILFGKFNVKSNKNLTNVQIYGNSILQYANELFYYCDHLTSVDISNAYTGFCTSMELMFWDCEQITSLSINDIDTSNVTDMSYMFNACSKLETLDVSNFDTSNVTMMASMFSGCSKLETLDISNFDTSNVTTMGDMFSACNAITKIKVSRKFHTSNVTDMSCMFNGCFALTEIDGIDYFNTSNVTTMQRMFQGCAFTLLDILNFTVKNVSDMSYMFANCKQLKKVTFSFNSNALNDLTCMFSNCYELERIGNFTNTSNVGNFGEMFNNCRNLEALHLSDWSFTNASTLTNFLSGTNSLTVLRLSSNFYNQSNNSIDGGYASYVLPKIPVIIDASTTRYDLYFSNFVNVMSSDKVIYSDGNFIFKEENIELLCADYSETFNDVKDTLSEKITDGKTLNECNYIFNGLQFALQENSQLMIGNDYMKNITLKNNIFLNGPKFTNNTTIESVNMSGTNYCMNHDLSDMFKGCTNLKSVDLSGLIGA